MKKLFAILLTATMLLSAFVIPSSAAIPPQLYGDVEYDEDVNILDATAIQKYLAGLIRLGSRGFEAADVDGDTYVSVMDATTIQMYLANVITEFPAGEYYLIDKYLYEVTPSAMSGKAQVGVPVDFEISGYAYPSPQKAYLYVNDELVDTAEAEDTTLTYTFLQAGTYSVKAVLTDKWGGVAGSFETSYKVVEPVTDTSVPYISNIAITDKYLNKPTITVDAMYGSGDYTYSYYIYVPVYPEEAKRYDFVLENTTESSVTLDYGVLEYYATYTIDVVVTDSNGNTASATTTFECIQVAPA